MLMNEIIMKLRVMTVMTGMENKEEDDDANDKNTNRCSYHQYYNDTVVKKCEEEHM